MKGKAVIDTLQKRFGVNTNTALAGRLGITVQAINNWRQRPSVTVRQVAGLVYKAHEAGASALQSAAIRPLAEFFPITRSESKGGAGFELFSVDGEDGARHPYLEGLRAELQSHHGIYVFFDSRGQAIYTGKARLQNLWKEMNLAFNRKRGDVQKIRRVSHPTRKVIYRTSEEKDRQIIARAVPLHELAAYFSAYMVADAMINKLEAMLVRSFANDLLNVRMERFGRKKSEKKK